MIPKRKAWFQLLCVYRCSHFGQRYFERPHAPPNDSPLWWIIKGIEMQTRRLSMKLIFWSSNPNRKNMFKSSNRILIFFSFVLTSPVVPHFCHSQDADIRRCIRCNKVRLSFMAGPRVANAARNKPHDLVILVYIPRTQMTDPYFWLEKTLFWRVVSPQNRGQK